MMELLLGLTIYGTLLFAFLAWNRDDILFSIILEAHIAVLVAVEVFVLVTS